MVNASGKSEGMVMGTAKRYHKTFPVSWEQLHRDAKARAWRRLETGPYEGIICIARGGLVPGAIVARELEVRLIETVCVSSYDWQDQGAARVLKSVRSSGKGWLIIDDLVDTGRTARLVRDMLPEARFACVYVKPEGRAVADAYVTEVSQDTWILFPWDSEVRFVEPIIHRADE